ncbi:MAG: hypothetical protein WCK49_09905 [Myxococcaceae bacterium]
MKFKTIVLGTFFLFVVACGDTVVHEHKHIQEHKTETIEHHHEAWKLLGIDELNEKLATLVDENEFDAQVLMSIQKFEKKNYVFVRVLKDETIGHFRMLSWEEIENLECTDDLKMLGCEHNGKNCLYEAIHQDSLESVLIKKG